MLEMSFARLDSQLVCMVAGAAFAENFIRQFFGCAPVRVIAALQQMAINVKRDLDLGMAHCMLDELQVLALLNELAGVVMA